MQIDTELLKQRDALNELVTGLHSALSDVNHKLEALQYLEKDIHELVQISNNLGFELLRLETQINRE